MIQADQHLHSHFSADSEENIQNIIDKAKEMKLNTICMTDHIDPEFPKERYGWDFMFPIKDYFDEINILREKNAEITIHTGVEIGLKPDIKDICKKITDAYDFDFVIGSTHLVYDTDPYYEDFWEEYPDDTGILAYYEDILFNCKNDFDFDVYGHLDYILRYSPDVKKLRNNIKQTDEYIRSKAHKYMDIIDEILKSLIYKGKGIECNTAGYKYGMNHPNPHEDILKRYHELGGEIITIGSDAHKACHVGYYFENVEKILSSAGFKYYTVFENRTPIMLPL